MVFPRYLVMTGAEIASNPLPPGLIGYMACHFSPYGTGLSNLPEELPTGALVLLSDRTPPCGHDPERIADMLTRVLPEEGCVLLDFQRPGLPENEAVAKALVEALPCPVGVTPEYARALACPVFLPPVPLRVPVAQYLRPWAGREVWLDCALDGEIVTVTAAGADCVPVEHPQPEALPFADEALCCHYKIQCSPDAIRFTLRRTREDLENLLEKCPALGVTRAAGLWQELGDADGRTPS